MFRPAADEEEAEEDSNEPSKANENVWSQHGICLG